MKSNNKPVILYTFYRPPDSKPEVIHQINESIQNNPESSRIILVGDFNLPSIKWSSDQSAPVNTGGSAENEIFCDLVDDNFFEQYILALRILLVINSICCCVTLLKLSARFPPSDL